MEVNWCKRSHNDFDFSRHWRALWSDLYHDRTLGAGASLVSTAPQKKGERRGKGVFGRLNGHVDG